MVQNSRETIEGFLAKAEQNSQASLKNLPAVAGVLEQINRVAQDANDALVNSPDWFLVLFLGRAHSAFLAAVRLATAGQVPEAYMVLRGALENAMYALHIKADPEELRRVELWLRRGDSDTPKHAVIGEFRMGNLRESLQAADTRVATIANLLYERCIELGAHPNKLGLLTSVAWDHTDDSVPVFQVFAITANRDALMLSLKTAVEVGLTVLNIFSHVYRTRFELVGLLERIKALENLVEPTFRPFYQNAG